MSEAKGKLLTCDRCGETVFLSAVSESLLDGGFTKNTKFEDAPGGWDYHREPGAYGCHLCPTCNKSFKSIMKAFMEQKSFTIY